MSQNQTWTDIGNIEIRQIGTKTGGWDTITYATDEVWGIVTTADPVTYPTFLNNDSQVVNAYDPNAVSNFTITWNVIGFLWSRCDSDQSILSPEISHGTLWSLSKCFSK